MQISHVRWLSSGDPATDATLEFAARELARYVTMLTDARWTVTREGSLIAVADTVWLGLYGRLPQPPQVELTPALWDDGYAIWGRDGNCYIAGQNARSVLFGVYDWLERQGVRFVRPGPDGEVVPHVAALTFPDRPIVEQAYYRHRGVCIEGAPSLEHTLGMVDWCAKKRMNTLFLQFFSSRYFYNNWYARAYNPQFADHVISDQEAIAMDQQVIAALKLRGQVLHQVGHGWTGATVGLPRSGWVTADEPVAPDRVRWLAEVNGERKLFHEIPINTELCYSYRPAFDAMVETIVRYVTTHPEVDIVHVWLSDATNNKCECAECRALTISDWYAKLINALSEALQAQAPGKRFVFLCYIELLWPPEQVMVDDRYGNIVMMFAPISRSFGRALNDPTCDDGQPYPRPELNRFTPPRCNAFFVRTLHAWRDVFGGDSFDFDYHLMWAVWAHLTDTVAARVIYEDLQDLQALGLDGLVSCQPLRNYYPSGLAMAVMAEALWDPHVPLAEMRRGYLEAAFGEHAAYVGDYLQRLEAMLDPGDPDWRVPPLSNKNADELQQADAFLAESLAALTSRLEATTRATHRRSLDILCHHARFLRHLVRTYQALAADDMGAARAALADATAFLQDTEPLYHRVMDTQLMLRVVVDGIGKRIR